MARKTILIFVSAYLPGYKAGGPIRSIANLVDCLGNEFDFWIVTADRDRGALESYPGIKPGIWCEVGKAKVLYLSPSQQRFVPFLRIMRQVPYDVIYLNSFFNPKFTLLPIIALKLRLTRMRPIILAPRGEFSVGALAIKNFKKRTFLKITKMIGLHRKIIWQASSLHELDDITRAMDNLACTISVVQNLPKRTTKSPNCRVRKSEDPLRVVYLGRIVPIKNLLFAFDVLSRVKARVEFSIYGPHEDVDYKKLCVSKAATLPENISVNWNGSLPADQVIETLARHDLFFLPSLGENFGHAIAEALQAGLRLLISDQTPWRDLETAGVGYDFSLNSTNEFVRAIEFEASTLPSPNSVANIQSFFVKATGINENINANRCLLNLRGYEI